MYKAFIADDEEIIRRGIARLLEKDPEIQVVATAEDGEIALQEAQAHLPDLLFVDINMPFVNGLEFIEQLGGILKNAVIIVITGYDDFAYAQKALRLGVFDYLLKPLMEDAFYDAVNRAKEQLAREQRQIQYLEWARLQVQKNRPLLIAEFADRWLSGELSAEEIDERMQYLELELPAQFAVVLLHWSEFLAAVEPGEAWDEDLLYYAVQNITLEFFSEQDRVCAYKSGSGDLVLMLASGPDMEWDSLCRQLILLLEQHLPLRACHAVCVGKDRYSIPMAYEEAVAELYRQGSESPVISEARQYIHRHFHNSDFSLQQAARHLHISPQHLSRQFRRETGITFMDYVTRCRIRKAVELLAQDKKIYEVAEQTGYASQHYFSSSFKKVLGSSPMEYRKEQLQH